MGLVAAGGALADSVEGRWLTEEKTGVVEIYRCDSDTLCGRLLWLRIRPKDDNHDALDLRNPAPELRARPLCGLVMMGGFRHASLNEWNDGWLYDPENGHTYSGEMTLRPDGTLRLRGYIGISLFGRSETWTPWTEVLPRCPAE